MPVLPCVSFLLKKRAGRNVRVTLKTAPQPCNRSLVGLGADVRISQRHLPHWTVSGDAGESAIYWITFRLADSIPMETLRAWRQARALWLHAHPQPWNENTWSEYNELFGDRFEAWLDQGNGSRALAKHEIREVVRDCLMRFDGKRLDVRAAVIMPTHVHVLLQPLHQHKIAALLGGIKGASAREANRLLGTTGAFWQDESYDHIVRSNEQLWHYLRYIEDNPRRAGLREDEYWLYKK